MKRFEYLSSLSHDVRDATLFVSSYETNPNIYEIFDWLNEELTEEEIKEYKGVI